MSGGEQQRVAIAVAIANQPSVLLADEPTGELDSVTAESVFAALKTANTDLGVTVLIVTHDPAVSSNVRRVIAIRDGRTSTETLRHDGGDGSALGHAIEYAVLDRAGRLQLPRDMTDSPACVTASGSHSRPTTSASGPTSAPGQAGSGAGSSPAAPPE